MESQSRGLAKRRVSGLPNSRGQGRNPAHPALLLLAFVPAALAGCQSREIACEENLRGTLALEQGDRIRVTASASRDDAGGLFFAPVVFQVLGEEPQTRIRSGRLVFFEDRNGDREVQEEELFAAISARLAVPTRDLRMVGLRARGDLSGASWFVQVETERSGVVRACWKHMGAGDS